MNASDPFARFMAGGMAAQKAVNRALAAHAFSEGFAVGAAGKRSRHQVDEATHKHWRAGYLAGKKAREDAVAVYEMVIR